MIKNIKIPAAIIIFILLCIYFLEMLNQISIITRDSILFACLISFINFIIFIVLLEFSNKGSNKVFLIYNLGGMGLRIILMLILVFLIIKFLKIIEFEFIFTFFLLYVLFLIYEINIIRQKVEKPLKARKNTEDVVQ